MINCWTLILFIVELRKCITCYNCKHWFGSLVSPLCVYFFFSFCFLGIFCMLKLFSLILMLESYKLYRIVSAYFSSIGNNVFDAKLFLATIQITDLPFSLYSTFVIEARHGFNKVCQPFFLSSYLCYTCFKF